jgi:hypothetical protein
MQKRTSNNFTYEQGSHVMQYGSLEIDTEPAGDYIGMNHTGPIAPSSSSDDDSGGQGKTATEISSRAHRGDHGRGGASWLRGWLQGVLEHLADMLAPVEAGETLSAALRSLKSQESSISSSSAAGAAAAAVSNGRGGGKHSSKKWMKAGQRHADLLPLMAKVTSATCPRKKAAASIRLMNELGGRLKVDSLVQNVANEVMKKAAVEGAPLLATKMPGAAAANGAGVVREMGALEWLVHGTSKSKKGAIVDDWDCLRGMVKVSWVKELQRSVIWLGYIGQQGVCTDSCFLSIRVKV